MASAIKPSSMSMLVRMMCSQIRVIRYTSYTHMRKTPKRGIFGIGAFNAADSDRPSTRRVCAGSMTPSSHSRALA